MCLASPSAVTSIAALASGAGVNVGTAGTVDVGVGTGVDVGATVGVGEGVAVGVGEGFGVGVSIGVGDGAAVGVAATGNVGRNVIVGTGVAVGPGSAIGPSSLYPEAQASHSRVLRPELIRPFISQEGTALILFSLHNSTWTSISGEYAEQYTTFKSSATSPNSAVCLWQKPHASHT